jgi:DNA primase
MQGQRSYMDFKAIKQRVGITDVLARYNVALTRVNQTALKGNCALPTHSSGSKNTFFVNEAKSVWYCHSDSCKKNGHRAGGNALDFVMLMESCSAYAAAAKLNEWFPEGNGKEEPVEPHPGMMTKEVFDALVNPANNPLAFQLKGVNPRHEMIQLHSISEATAAKFGVGYFPGKGSMAGRIVFPLIECGSLIGYAGRTTLPVTEANPKWLFGKGLKKTFVYGLERCDPAKQLVLTESFWAPLFFLERGVQAAALMGSEMTQEQEKCLAPFRTILVAMDNDRAGEEKSRPIIERLRSAGHTVLKARLME